MSNRLFVVWMIWIPVVWITFVSESDAWFAPGDFKGLYIGFVVAVYLTLIPLFYSLWKKK